MNLSQLEIELHMVLRDVTVQQSFPTWLNQSMLELAQSYELPDLKLKTPAVLTTVNTEWQYDIFDDVAHPQGYVYLKKLFRVTNPSDDDRNVPIARSIQAIDELDKDHNETDTEITKIGIEGRTLAVHRMATDSLNLWFYRRPVDMVNSTDEPDGLDRQYHYTVLIPHVVLRAFRIYPDLAVATFGENTRALQWWSGRLRAGIYGDASTIGLLSNLAKNRPPQIRGPRQGKNLSGGMRRAW